MYIDPVTKNISVHGREALNLPYARWSTDGTTQLNISASIMFIEIPGANLRLPLAPNPNDPLGLIIYITRADVALIPVIPSPYTIIDETVTDAPFLELEALIYRTGYTQQPTITS